jgi:trehalose 6-phosphate phosphatase
VAGSSIRTLAHALRDHDAFTAALAGRRPAVFLDYDGVLTPIVDRPEDARMTDDMRRVVRELAERAPVCVVSGRDRAVVQELMGVDDLVVAGGHGFDIWHPERGTLEHEAATGYEALVEEVIGRLRAGLGGVDGVILEPKRASVGVHYRLADEQGRRHTRAVLRRLLDERSDQLRMTPGKMIDEVQPKIDWNKGRAVEYLLAALDLNGPEYVPLYLGDDVTDEDAFRVVRGHGIGVYVGEAAGLDRDTDAEFTVASPDEVRTLLDGLAR